MNRKIHELIYNPNALSSHEVIEILHSDETSYKELVSVLGESIVHGLVTNGHNSCCFDALSDRSRYPLDYGQYTQVFVWGLHKSGKTCVIASLMAAMKDDSRKLLWMGDANSKARCEAMINYFKAVNWRFDAIRDEDEHIVARLDVECKVGSPLISRHYPLSFIEVDLGCDKDTHSSMVPLQRGMAEGTNQIHLLCFDCSQTQYRKSQQAEAFITLLERLRTMGALGRSSGLYLLVTKMDTMLHVPNEYRFDAAQTVITAGQKELWQQVVNACYDMEIYDAKPCPYTIGEVVLKDFIKPDLTLAKQLFTNQILLKAEARPTIYERMLHSIGWFGTLLVGLVVLIVVGYGGWSVFKVLEDSPFEHVEPYVFSRDFLKREAVLSSLNYDDAKKLYKDLHWELLVERGIKLADGESLNDVTPECSKKLASDFAQHVRLRFEDLYNQSSWSKGANDMKDVCESAGWLLGDSAFIDTNDKEQLKKYRTYYFDLNKIKTLLINSLRCQSWDDVKDVQNKQKKYIIYPYVNDNMLKSDLDRVVVQAYESYAGSLYQKAKQHKSDYDDEVNIGKNKGCPQSYFKDLNAKYTAQTDALREEIEEAQNRIPDDCNSQRTLEDALTQLSF